MDKEKSLKEDHSVHGYVKRLSTEELKQLLCADLGNAHRDTYSAIFCELKNRYNQNSNEG